MLFFETFRRSNDGTTCEIVTTVIILVHIRTEIMNFRFPYLELPKYLEEALLYFLPHYIYSYLRMKFVRNFIKYRSDNEYVGCLHGDPGLLSKSFKISPEERHLRV
jgi:hypothetical protein